MNKQIFWIFLLLPFLALGQNCDPEGGIIERQMSTTINGLLRGNGSCILGATLGNGLTMSPAGTLNLAQQGATSGQVLKWNGTAWVPSVDAGGGGVDTLPSYAALRAYTGASNAIFVRNHSHIIGGVFVRQTTTAADDGGVVLNGAGGVKWVRLRDSEKEIWVDWYELPDAAKRWQRAVDAAGNEGVVYGTPSRTYTMRTGVTLRYFDRMTIDGQWCTMLHPNGSACEATLTVAYTGGNSVTLNAIPSTLEVGDIVLLARGNDNQNISQYNRVTAITGNVVTCQFAFLAQGGGTLTAPIGAILKENITFFAGAPSANDGVMGLAGANPNTTITQIIFDGNKATNNNVLGWTTAPMIALHGRNSKIENNVFQNSIAETIVGFGLEVSNNFFRDGNGSCFHTSGNDGTMDSLISNSFHHNNIINMGLVPRSISEHNEGVVLTFSWGATATISNNTAICNNTDQAVIGTITGSGANARRRIHLHNNTFVGMNGIVYGVDGSSQETIITDNIFDNCGTLNTVPYPGINWRICNNVAINGTSIVPNAAHTCDPEVYAQITANASKWAFEGGGPDIFKATGNVGINTTAPVAPLHITTNGGAGTTRAALFERGGGWGEHGIYTFANTSTNGRGLKLGNAADTDKFTFDVNNGRLVIGQETSDVNLDVIGTTRLRGNVVGVTANTLWGGFNGYKTEVSTAAPLSFSGNVLGVSNSGVTAGTYTNANITVNQYGFVTAASNGSGGGGSNWTVNGSNIYRSSNVGIGTSAEATNPRDRLTVAEGGLNLAYGSSGFIPSTNGWLSLGSVSNIAWSRNAGIYLARDYFNTYGVDASVGTMLIKARSGNRIGFLTGADSTSASVKLWIDPTGVRHPQLALGGNGLIGVDGLGYESPRSLGTALVFGSGTVGVDLVAANYWELVGGANVRRSTGTVAIGLTTATNRLSVESAMNIDYGTAGVVVGANDILAFGRRTSLITGRYGAGIYSHETAISGITGGVGNLIIQGNSNSAQATAGISFVTGTTPAERLHISKSGAISSPSWASTGNRLLFANSSGEADESTIDPATLATTANTFQLGGNTVTAAATLGTNSNHDLNIETNGVTRLTVTTDNKFTFADAAALTGGIAGQMAYSDNAEAFFVFTGGFWNRVLTLADITPAALNLPPSNFTLSNKNYFTRVNANTSAITVTLGGGLENGVIYTVRCINNDTNTVTFSAASGYVLEVDGSNTVTSTSVSVGGGGSGFQADFQIYSIRRVDNNIFIYN